MRELTPMDLFIWLTANEPLFTHKTRLRINGKKVSGIEYVYDNKDNPKEVKSINLIMKHEDRVATTKRKSMELVEKLRNFEF